MPMDELDSLLNRVAKLGLQIAVRDGEPRICGGGCWHRIKPEIRERLREKLSQHRVAIIERFTGQPAMTSISREIETYEPERDGCYFAWCEWRTDHGGELFECEKCGARYCVGCAFRESDICQWRGCGGSIRK